MAADTTGRTGQLESIGEGMGSDRSMLILYGSETGHSEEIAREIGETAERLRFEASVEAMNDVSLKELVQHSLAVFVASTTGQGDLPANANTFWKSLLRKKLPPTCLSQLRFTIFGLGDSSYPKFNWAARKLQKRLLQLGAVEVYPAGEGDERHDNGIDSIYLPWFEGFKTHLSTELPLPNGIAPIPDDGLLPPKYPISVEDMSSEDPAVKAARYEANRTKHAAISHIYSPKSDDSERDDLDGRRNDIFGTGQFARAGGPISDRLTAEGQVQLDKDNILKDHAAKYDLLEPSTEDEVPPRGFIPIPDTWASVLVENRRVTPESHWQDVRLLEIKIRDSGWNENVPCLQPGDNAIIFPKNFPSDAQKMIDLMGWHSIADRKIVWSNRGERPKCPRNLHCPGDATLRDVLVHNLDITAVPNRTFLKQLQRHTTDEREKERLLELTQESNTQEFYDYTSRPRRTILEVLEDFPGVKIPMEYALEIFPIIRGRVFSIANHALDHQDGKVSSRTIKILVALVEYKTIIRKPRQGLCSRYIKALRGGTQLIVGLKRHHPPPFGEVQSRRPLIAVATGTGIAPIMSLIQERHLWADTDSGRTLLFFGCRNRDADFHFKDDLQRFNRVKVIPAFSRDPINPDDNAFLDPYANQDKSLVKPRIELSTEPAPIGPHNTPWVRSFDYDRGKMYVQHLIRREAKEVCLLVQQARNAGLHPIIMICGNAGRMPVSVRHALEDALVIGGLFKDNETAKAYLQSSVGIWMETW